MHLSRGVLSLLTVALLFLVLGAVAGWRILATENQSGGSQQADLPSTEGVVVSSADDFLRAQRVSGVPVVRDTLWIHVTATGTAEAYRQSVVGTRTDGVVQTVQVRENDFVQTGDILIQLDTLEAAMELAEAEANLQSLMNEFEARRLAGGPVEDPSIREERERNLRAQVGLVPAEMRVRRARMELELTRVTAPFAGRIADLAAVEGAYLSSGAEVLTLVQLDPIKVQAEVMESDLVALGTGRRATVQFSAFPGQTFSAQVETVNPLVDVESRSGRVTTGRRNETHVEIISAPEGAPETSMLEPGEIVLVDNHQYLAHDTRVQLDVPPDAALGSPGE